MHYSAALELATSRAAPRRAERARGLAVLGVQVLGEATVLYHVLC